MNERIEQLWKRVNLLECDCGCNPDEYMRMRFAELIIDECLDIILASDSSDNLLPQEPYTTIVCNITEHFWGETSHE